MTVPNILGPSPCLYFTFQYVCSDPENSSTEERRNRENYHIMVLCILLVSAVFVRDGYAPGVIACAFVFFVLTAVKVRDFLDRKRQSGR